MERKFIRELAKQFPNRDAVASEIINLNAILNLPKGTEHFISDVHGEYEAFSHIRRNASGVIKRKVDLLFSDTLDEEARAELATLIYYPEEKLELIKRDGAPPPEWYLAAIERLVVLCRHVSAKYTRSKVRGCIDGVSEEYSFILGELLFADYTDGIKTAYYGNIVRTVVRTGAAERFIIALSVAIRRLVVDHLHIVGDIFDRGPRADIILDELMREGSIDIQWGNHDALWMGAAAGSRVCIATVLNNSMTYRNLDVIEVGYGISLRPLAQFADEVYSDSDVSAYMPKGEAEGNLIAGADDALVARMHKAISIIQFKLEGQTIMRNPSYHMEDRLLLGGINATRGTVTIENREYKLLDSHFPTLDPRDPYRLTEGEAQVMQHLKWAFTRSEKLARHIRFLYERGECYKVYNRNLLFHGCIPLDDSGEFLSLDAVGGKSGRELMDAADKLARQGYFAKEGTEERQVGKDFLWFLWCGKDSPLAGRKKIATLERQLTADKALWDEPRNAYYRIWDDEKIAVKILSEFGLSGARSHIINGHIPIVKGDAPIKAGGRLIVIDGGFSKPFHTRTGIAGYTLIYNAEGMRISAHESFRGHDEAIHSNSDILSETVIFEESASKILVKDTDKGAEILDRIADLMMLLRAYESASVKESYRKV